ncbi:MAG: helix-turn-helix domain-containing protein, partial [Mesorhizobium sp.]
MPHPRRSPHSIYSLGHDLRTEFGLDVHPRTIERALGVKKTT